MNNVSEPVVTVLAGLIGLAMVAVLVSRNAQTGNVIGAIGGAFSNAVSAATAPVTGNSAAPNVTAGLSNNGFNVGSGGNLFGGSLSLGSNLFG